MDENTLSSHEADLAADYHDTNTAISQQAIEDAEKALIASLPSVAAEVIKLAKHAEDERIRATMCKFLIDRYLMKPGDDPTKAWDSFFDALHGKKNAKGKTKSAND